MLLLLLCFVRWTEVEKNKLLALAFLDMLLLLVFMSILYPSVINFLFFVIWCCYVCFLFLKIDEGASLVCFFNCL